MTSGNANDVSAVHELKFQATFVESPTMSTIPAAIILGIVCGLLGALFIWVNTNLSKIRKRIITKKWQKLVTLNITKMFMRVVRLHAFEPFAKLSQMRAF